MLKRMAITSLAAAAFFSTATVVTAPFTPADAQVSITFGSPPPPPRYEVVPAPRAGYVWAPGHYELINDQYVWRPGQWMTERPGYRYVAPSWAQVGNQWRYVPSRWDRNGDGGAQAFVGAHRQDRHHDRKDTADAGEDQRRAPVEAPPVDEQQRAQPGRDHGAADRVDRRAPGRDGA